MPTTTSKHVYAHITKDPEVCGGKACIDGTRIRVMDIVGLHQHGYTPEKMLNVYSSPDSGPGLCRPYLLLRPSRGNRSSIQGRSGCGGEAEAPERESVVAGHFPLFTDPHVQQSIVEGLSRRGWDVERAIVRERTKDPVLLDYAVTSGRAFVANDSGIIQTVD